MVWAIAGAMTDSRNLPYLAQFTAAVLVLFGITQAFSWLEEAEQERQQVILDQQAGSLAGLLAGDERLRRELGSASNQNYFSRKADARPVLDGRADDWSGEAEIFGADNLLVANTEYQEADVNYRLRISGDNEFFYLLYKVIDDEVVYRQVNHLSVHRNDHIRIGLIDDDGNYRRFTVAAVQPGHVDAVEVSRAGRSMRSIEMMSGRWLATGVGYNVELQVPRAMIRGRFSTVVADVDDPDERIIDFVLGKSATDSAERLGYLIESPTPLEQVVSGLPFPARVSNPSGTLSVTADSWPQADYLESHADIVSGTLKLGALWLRQPLPQILTAEQKRRFVLAALLLLLVIAVPVIYVSERQRRSVIIARQESERMARQNDYLERMASRLNHELQTPVSVIRSSLEHMVTGPSADDVYLERAREGLRRLATILDKMAEARRLEEALDEDEIIRFNLVDVATGCIEGYRLAFQGTDFDLVIEETDIPVTGIPELLAQGLDKIVDNAVEFSTGEAIRVRLNIEDGSAVLRVMNEGPSLPAGSSAELFDSMISVREGGDHHLGLGLYVAKTIVEFHGGQVSLGNREDVAGVVATLKLPILRVTAKLS